MANVKRVWRKVIEAIWVQIQLYRQLQCVSVSASGSARTYEWTQKQPHIQNGFHFFLTKTNTNIYIGFLFGLYFFFLWISSLNIFCVWVLFVAAAAAFLYNIYKWEIVPAYVVNTCIVAHSQTHKIYVYLSIIQIYIFVQLTATKLRASDRTSE